MFTKSRGEITNRCKKCTASYVAIKRGYESDNNELVRRFILKNKLKEIKRLMPKTPYEKSLRKEKVFKYHNNYQRKRGLKEREAQAEKDRLAKIEQDKKDAEIAKLKSEQESEKKRLQAIENDRIAKEKALANASDKEKIKAFFTEYVALIDKFPTLTSEDGKLLQSRAT